MAEKLEGKTVKLQDANGSVILPRTLAKNVQMADGVNDLENTIAKIRQDMKDLVVGDVTGTLDEYAKKDEVAEKEHKHLASDVIVVAATEDGQPEVSVASALEEKADKSQLVGLASEEYVSQKIADLVDGAPDTLDTLKEVAEALGENKTALDALNQVAGSKAEKEHIHVDLEEKIAKKADVFHNHTGLEIKIDGEKTLAVSFQEVLDRLLTAEGTIATLQQSMANANAKIAKLQQQMETVLQGKPEVPVPQFEAPVLLGMAKVYHEHDAFSGVTVNPEEVCKYDFLKGEGSEIQELTKAQLDETQGTLVYTRSTTDTPYMCLCLFVPIAYGQINAKVLNGANIDEIGSYQQGTCTLTIQEQEVEYGYLIRKTTQIATDCEKSTFSVTLAE